MQADFHHGLLGGSAASSRDLQISYRRVWVGDLGIEHGLRKRLQNILRFRPDHRDLDRLFAVPGPLPQVPEFRRDMHDPEPDLWLREAGPAVS